ncbi:MAG: TIGR04141 family sporadically distributed protein [Proteobacteria bacterium]|nr:TIGR04141 family sporadically distributed protein [Pseudomonadota bacterium]
MQGKVPLRHLNVFLLKEDVKSAKDALRSGRGVEECAPLSRRNAVGRLFVARSRSRPPKWARLFEGHFDTGKFGKVSSTAGVLFLEKEGRLFALSFGHGRYLLLSSR